MPEAAYSSNMTEAVAVFHDVETFQAAIDELLLAGFDHADVNVLAQEDTVTSKLGPPTRQPPSSRTIPRLRASPIFPMKPSATRRAPSSAPASMCPPCSAALQ